MDHSEITLSKEAINRLISKIILKESKNIKDRAISDDQMINWIKKQIEEEVQCYLNQ